MLVQTMRQYVWLYMTHNLEMYLQKKPLAAKTLYLLIFLSFRISQHQITTDLTETVFKSRALTATSVKVT